MFVHCTGNALYYSFSFQIPRFSVYVLLFVEIYVLDLLDLGEDQVDNAFPCNRWTRPQTPRSRVTADVT